MDTERSHRYADADVRGVAEGEPQVPYALHLTDTDHRFRFVVFDLDTGRATEEGAVWRDADTLLEHLDQAGLEYVVARSGPTGGIHVWVPVAGEEGLDPDQVARVAEATARHLSTLDTGMLHNPRTGAVRPPGAPHRDGGRAELLHPVCPDEALSVFDGDVNTAQRFEALAQQLGSDEETTEETPESAAARFDAERVALRGRRRPMPDMVRHLLNTPPAEDASAHLFKIFPRLALARWSLADVRTLVATEPDAPGLEYLRSRRTARGRRPRPAAEAEALLVRQWRRAVRSAASLAPPADRAERDLSGLRAMVAQTLEACAHASGWTRQAGQADRRVLMAVHLLALGACVVEVDADIRRVAQLAGVGRSTAHRALDRLCADGRLQVAEQAQGQHATRYRLIPRDQWVLPISQGGTQGEPTPQGSPHHEGLLPTREDLLTRLRDRLTIAQQDVWSEGGAGQVRGLGRHLEATYAALTVQSSDLDTVNLEMLGANTGYTPPTTRRHLRILAQHGLIHPTTSAPTTQAQTAMEEAATRLGTTGTHAVRERRYEAERAVYADWRAEVARRRAPVALRPRRSRGSRYALTARGRPDHAAQLARHLAAVA